MVISYWVLYFTTRLFERYVRIYNQDNAKEANKIGIVLYVVLMPVVSAQSISDFY